MKQRFDNLTAPPKLSFSFVSEALGPNLLNRRTANPTWPSRFFSSITTDSRKITRGGLFVAIKGEKYDGHDFINSAIEQGVSGVICSRDKEIVVPDSVQPFIVKDTQEAYRLIGAAWRKSFSLPILAVAGSVGKTTTKELLAAILRGKWDKVLKTEGSQNGFLGIPMTLLEIRPEHQVAVIEIGIDDIGTMKQHLELVRPDSAILTAIAAEHLEHLKDIPTVAREEGEALSYVASRGGVVAINLDDSWIKPFAVTLRDGKRVCFTINNTALPDRSTCDQADILKGTLSRDGGRITFEGMGLSRFSIESPLPGRHNALNLAGAVAMARAAGLTQAEIASGLATFKPAKGRSEVHEFPDGKTVIADYYNASPASVAAGLNLLKQYSAKYRGKRPTFACLGDMLELGESEERFHREIAEQLKTNEVEHVFLYGPRMASLKEELGSKGFSGTVSHYETHSELSQALLGQLKSNAVVLIKGSRGMRMEEVWKALQESVDKKAL